MADTKELTVEQQAEMIEKSVKDITAKLDAKFEEMEKGFATSEQHAEMHKSINDLTAKLVELDAIRQKDEVFEKLEKVNQKLIEQGQALAKMQSKNFVGEDGKVSKNAIERYLWKMLEAKGLIKEVTDTNGKAFKAYDNENQAKVRYSDLAFDTKSLMSKAGEDNFIFNVPAGSQVPFNQAIPRNILSETTRIPLTADDHAIDIFNARNLTSGEYMTIMFHKNFESNAQLLIEGTAPSVASSRLEKDSADYKVFDYGATARFSHKLQRSAADMITALAEQLADNMQSVLDADIFTTGGDNTNTPYGALNTSESCTLFNPLLFEGKGGASANLISVAEFAKLQARYYNYMVNSMVINPLTASELNELRDADGNSIMDRRLTVSGGEVVAVKSMAKRQTTKMAENTMLIYNAGTQELGVREGVSSEFGYDKDGDFSKKIVTLRMNFAVAYGQRAILSAIYVDDITTAVSILGATATESLTRVQGYATASDASALTVATLTNTGAENVIAANLDAYKTAIASEASIADLAALQVVINTVNAA